MGITSMILAFIPEAHSSVPSVICNELTGGHSIIGNYYLVCFIYTNYLVPGPVWIKRVLIIGPVLYPLKTA